MDWGRFLRVGRLLLVLNLVPFVRSCDDNVGLKETIGFPLPYSSYSYGNYSFNEIVWIALIANIALLVLFAVILHRRNPSAIGKLASFRVLIFVTVTGIFFRYFNGFIFAPLIFATVAINELCGCISSLSSFIDFLARAVFIGLMIAYLAMFVKINKPELDQHDKNDRK